MSRSLSSTPCKPQTNRSVTDVNLVKNRLEETTISVERRRADDRHDFAHHPLRASIVSHTCVSNRLYSSRISDRLSGRYRRSKQQRRRQLPRERTPSPRNEAVCRSGDKAEMLVSSFSWCTSRTREVPVDWTDWCCSLRLRSGSWTTNPASAG